MNLMRSAKTSILLTRAHLLLREEQETVMEMTSLLSRPKSARSRWLLRALRKWCISRPVKSRCKPLYMNKEEVLARLWTTMMIMVLEATGNPLPDTIKHSIFKAKNSRTTILSITWISIDLRISTILLGFVLLVVLVRERPQLLPPLNRTLRSWVLQYWLFQRLPQLWWRVALLSSPQHLPKVRAFNSKNVSWSFKLLLKIASLKSVNLLEVKGAMS